RCIAVDTPVPSQFSHEILNANPYAYLDDAPLEERRARAVEMRRILPESVLEEVGKLDPDAIAQVQAEAWPDLRDADELHDLLHTLIVLPEVPDEVARWGQYFEQLKTQGRTVVATRSIVSGPTRYWVAVEHAKTFAMLFPDSTFEKQPAETQTSMPSRDDAILSAVTGWMAHLGPTSSVQMGTLLGLPTGEIENALLRMEASGSILRGKFTEAAIQSG